MPTSATGIATSKLASDTRSGANTWRTDDASRASLFFGELGELPIAGDGEYQQYSLGIRCGQPYGTDKATTAPVRVENHDPYKSRVWRLVEPA